MCLEDALVAFNIKNKLKNYENIKISLRTPSIIQNTHIKV